MKSLNDLYFEHLGQVHMRYCRSCGEYITDSWIMCVDCIKIYCWKCVDTAAFDPSKSCRHIAKWRAGK